MNQRLKTGVKLVEPIDKLLGNGKNYWIIVVKFITVITYTLLLHLFFVLMVPGFSFVRSKSRNDINRISLRFSWNHSCQWRLVGGQILPPIKYEYIHFCIWNTAVWFSQFYKCTPKKFFKKRDLECSTARRSSGRQ